MSGVTTTEVAVIQSRKNVEQIGALLLEALTVFFWLYPQMSSL